jgi:hypothetical protein
MSKDEQEYLILSGKFPYAHLNEQQIAQLSKVNADVPVEQLIQKQQDQFPIDLLNKQGG